MSNNKESHLATLEHLRQLSYLLDNAVAIPGTSFRVGADAIIGLLPFGGDVLVGIISIYIVYRAAKLGLPKATLVRMILNIFIDVVIGAIPMLGDIFDATWKCNTKNVGLLEKHLESPQAGKKADGRFLFFLIAGLVISIIALVVLIIAIVIILIKITKN